MKRLFLFSLTALLAVCCTDRVPSPYVDPYDGPGSGHDQIVLGKQLDDPYSVTNMEKALSAVYPTKASRVPVPTTHLYVRFKPQNESQYKQLENRGFELLDHPMDYEIVKEGDWYHDPSIPEEEFTWQYCVVPKDTFLPPLIPHEILHECYIPEEETKSADGIDWAAVERESFRLTGNGDLLVEPSRTKGSSAETPAGRITIVDPDLNAPEGVRGVRVACNIFVKTAHAFTDEDGRYRMSRSFSGKPRYRLVFKNSTGFCIGLNLLLVPASISSLGKGEAAGMDVQVTKDSDRRLFSRCVVNNAGFDYIKRCSAVSPSVKTPPSNFRLWLFQGLDFGLVPMLQQGVLIDRGEVGRILGQYAILVKLFLPDAAIGLKGKDTYASIYAEALHTFAHGSHFMLAGGDYWDHYAGYLIKSYLTSGFTLYGVGAEEDHGYCEVSEMWAYFAQTALFRERYGNAIEPRFGLDWWFHPQILSVLAEKGLEWQKVFQVLSSDVTDREVLQKKLSSYYPEYKSAINQAFAQYN